MKSNRKGNTLVILILISFAISFGLSQIITGSLTKSAVISSAVTITLFAALLYYFNINYKKRNGKRK